MTMWSNRGHSFSFGHNKTLGVWRVGVVSMLGAQVD
jgi:hypothetical protein